MLTDVECLALCCRLNLSADAQTLLQQIRTAPPSRRVQNHAGNVKVRYPSRKMGVTIQAESHRNELAGIYEKEHDPQTLEYYDQPPPLGLRYEARNGRLVKVRHTPDYFVIREHEVGWEEWKPANALVTLATKMPHRYVQDASGGRRCPPGEAYAQAFGFFYQRCQSRCHTDGMRCSRMGPGESSAVCGRRWAKPRAERDNEGLRYPYLPHQEPGSGIDITLPIPPPYP